MDVLWPVPKAYIGRTTKEWGGDYPAHDGLDIGVGAGNTSVPCLAVAAGVVTESLSSNVSYGTRVTIDHGRGLRTRYCHLQYGSRTVKVGDKVAPGQKIGMVGSTGNSPYGEHLHFMVYRGAGTVNPRTLLSGAGAVSAPTKGGQPVDITYSDDGGDKEKREPLPSLRDYKSGSGRSRASLGDDSFRINGKGVRADIEELIVSATLDLAVERVGQLTLLAADPTTNLSSRDLRGAILAWDGAKWDISASRLQAADGQMQIDARSRLARRMRNTYRVVGEHKVRPDQWITRTVSRLGGKAIVASASKRGVLPDNKDQSAWDALSGLCSDLGWSFTEYAGRVYAGPRSWAADGGTGLPTWPVTWRSDEATDLLDADVALTDDDPDDNGTGDLALTWAMGRRLRPWHRLRLRGLGQFDGLWLVEAVNIPNDGTSVVTATVARPRRTAQRGTTVREAAAPADEKSPAFAKWYAKREMAKRYRWGEAQFDALEQLWTRESGWRWNAENPSSGAYGIPQSLPGSKMASAGKDWRTNPKTQIKWGLGYIKGRYGTPQRAWAHFQANNWY